MPAVHATCLLDWTVGFDATGHPTVVSGDDVTVFFGTDGSVGGAYATLGTPDGSIPSGVTPTLTHIKVTAHGNGGHVAPLVLFNGSDNPTHTLKKYALVGSGGVGESLDGDSSSHLMDYDAAYIAGILGTDPQGLYDAAVAGTAVVFVMIQSAVSASIVAGDSVTYTTVEVTWEWADPLPCNTTVDLDLSAAVFANPAGDQFGQYVDGVITGLAGSYAEFSFGLTLDPLKAYRVEVTFDPGSARDGDGNPATSDRWVLLYDLLPGDELAPANSVQIGDGFSNTSDVATLTIGPGRGNWDDPDFGVGQGFTGLLFQTSESGAVSAVSVTKLCVFAAPPLRLTNRDDMFGSARRATGSSSRQASNRLTGYL